MAKRQREIETFEIPHEYMVFADQRTAAIVRRCCYDANIVESVARSCYLQGLWDGLQLGLERPDLLEQVRRTPEGAQHEPET